MADSAVTTRQLTVNAAFLQEIKDDNQQLKQLWDKVTPMAERPETALNHWPELVELFAELRDQLALHFSLEEAYGYFDEAVDIAPQLTSLAECLRGEHAVLFSQIRDLADAATEANSEREEGLVPCIKAFKKFKKQFQSHEESELKLILQAMDDDIGGGD
ncbi:MAG: hemerythrin domain-containing protein [Pirellulaceae bacterium]|nr:hemerythrin domain-containing protein [Pirellulaceae bacterium]